MILKNIKFKSGAILIASLLFFNYGFAQNKLRIGIWRGILTLNDTTQLPFNFEVKSDLDIYSVVFTNAEEKITANEIVIQGDSVFIRMPVFDSEFKLKSDGDSLKGVWINHNRKDKNVLKFKAYYGNKNRFEIKYWTNYEPVVTGKWEVEFEPGTPDSYKSIGEFKQLNVVQGSKLTGTFITETGDYRYLEGIMANNDFYLSCFDGVHAFLFKAKLDKNKDILKGDFYSSAHGHETWIAKRNEKFQLRNPDSLTYLKPGFTKVDFSFKNLEGKQISLSDEKYKNKVVILQLMGTWCPNCMDETKFLAPFYDKYKSKGLEIIGLAFERTDDFNKAVSRVSRVKAKFDAKYDFLITMKTGAQQASEALPMLNKVMAFPTTIYIDKKGDVRKIYTGYYGPATGDSYIKQEEETTKFVEKLLGEK